MGPVFVTGSDGFVGRAVCRALREAGIAVRRGVRVPTGAADEFAYGDLRQTPDFLPLVRGCSAVIHLAAKVHDIGSDADDETIFQSVNVDATVRLAQAAARASVPRFIFASTLGVHAAKTGIGLRPDAEIGPQTPYARSKWLAEEALRVLEKAGQVEAVMIRPPLVYGPHCPGNMARLARLVGKGLPLPFGSVRNARSFIDIENLAQVFLKAARAPGAGGRAFLVSDGEDVSLVETLHFLAEGMGRKAKLFSVSGGILRGAAHLAGKGGEMSKLIDSLTIDNEMAAAALEYVPGVRVAEGLRRTGASFHPAETGP